MGGIFSLNSTLEKNDAKEKNGLSKNLLTPKKRKGTPKKHKPKNVVLKNTC